MFIFPVRKQAERRGGRIEGGWGECRYRRGREGRKEKIGGGGVMRLLLIRRREGERSGWMMGLFLGGGGEGNSCCICVWCCFLGGGDGGCFLQPNKKNKKQTKKKKLSVTRWGTDRGVSAWARGESRGNGEGGVVAGRAEPVSPPIIPGSPNPGPEEKNPINHISRTKKRAQKEESFSSLPKQTERIPLSFNSTSEKHPKKETTSWRKNHMCAAGGLNIAGGPGKAANEERGGGGFPV